MSLSEMIYCPLKEEENNLAGWSKDTIDYVVEKSRRVHASIRGIAKSRGRILQKDDVEDIYMELIQYLYKCDDYNVAKACERSSIAGQIVSLEGYIHSCIKYCVIRYITQLAKRETSQVRESYRIEDDEEISLYDSIADKSQDDAFNKLNYDLDTVCKSFESERYSMGIDVFELWFIRILTLEKNKKDKYIDVLTILGISKKEINYIEKNNSNDGIMMCIAKAVSIVGTDNALKVLRKYVRYPEKIERVINEI